MHKAFTLLEAIAGPVQREIGELEFPSRKCPHVRPSICADGMMLQDRSRSNFRAKEGVFPGLQLIRRPIEAARGGPFVDDKSPLHQQSDCECSAKQFAKLEGDDQRLKMS